jgi:hypothetical protein
VGFPGDCFVLFGDFDGEVEDKAETANHRKSYTP